MSDAGLLLAFLGGLLALLSPCSALLLPAFFAYSFTNRTRLFRHTAAFYGGLCLTLVPLGAAGAFASRLFIGHRDTLVLIGGWTMIVLGVLQLLGLGFGSRRLQQRAGAPSGAATSTIALGAVYGLAGFCAGPILGSILTVAALGGSPCAAASSWRCTPWAWPRPYSSWHCCGTAGNWGGVRGCAVGVSGSAACTCTAPR